MLMCVRVGKGGIDKVMRYYGISREEYARLNRTPIESVREGMLVLMDVRDVEHVVRPFETLERIATRYGVTVHELSEYNGIDRVFLGDVLLIPPHASDEE